MGISIHPPRVGWDCSPASTTTNGWNFNPPTPCGVGLFDGKQMARLPIFQSTHPVWGGTGVRAEQAKEIVISIHPPRTGWDVFWVILREIPFYFNPPTPCGVGRPV